MPNNFEINLPTDSFIPPSSSFPAQTMTTSTNRLLWRFDDTAPESVTSKPFRWPTAYTGTGTLKIDVFYAMQSATSGTIEFEVSLEAISDGDTDNLNTTESFDAVNTGSATVPGTSNTIDVVTITLTNKDSVAVGDMVRVKVARDADDGTNDTATGDLYIWLVTLYEEQ